MVWSYSAAMTAQSPGSSDARHVKLLPGSDEQFFRLAIAGGPLVYCQMLQAVAEPIRLHLETTEAGTMPHTSLPLVAAALVPSPTMNL